ncbi:MAG: efflux RND transporter permease subunit, partial [Chitinophagales bacterium]
FSYAFDDVFPKGDEELDFYYAFRDKFTPDDNFLLVGFERDQIFETEFLNQLDSATTQINRLQSVNRALSITNFRYFVKTGFGFIDYPAIHIDAPEKYISDSLRIAADERVVGKLISEDFNTIIIYIQTKDSLLQDANRALVEDVQAILTQNNLTNAHLLGKAFFEVELVDYQKKEFITYAVLSILMVSIIIFILYRSMWCVFIALSTVTINLILFIGMLGISGRTLNVMSTLYPIILIIVGISDTIHFLNRYILELRSNLDRGTAILNTLRDTGLATFLTSVTTAIGFLTLLSSKVFPVREFGVLAACGVLLAYGIVLFFTTPLLSLFNLRQLESLKIKKTHSNRWLTEIYHFTLHKPNKIIGVTALLTIVSIAGVFQITTNINLSNGLPDNTQVKEDFLFFENTFNGFRPFEMAVIVAPPYTVHSPEVLQSIDTIEQFIAGFPAISSLQTATVFYKSLNRAYNGDMAAAYHLPDSVQDFKKMRTDLKKFGKNELQFLISEDEQWTRMSGYVRDVGTDSIQKIQNAIATFAETHIDTSKVQFRI